MNLHEDILIEILIKLPAKSLIRAIIVCKSWRSLITSPSFISTHLSNSKNQALLRRYDIRDSREHYTVFPKRVPLGIKSAPEIEFPLKDPTIGYFRIVGSCDGLVCLCKYLEPITIWNPAIRNHMFLPQSLVNPNEAQLVVLGFGVASNVYKVVKLVFCKNPNDDGLFIGPPHAEIFSLGTKSWRKLSGFDFRGLRVHTERPIFIEGFVHWLAYEPMSENSSNSNHSILTFHIGDEVFGEIMLPEELKGVDAGSLSLSIIGESLGALKCYMYNPRCDVWIMKDYDLEESWTMLYRIDFEGFNRVVGFCGSDEALLVVRGELVTYNAETKQIKHVGVFGYAWSFCVDDYKESLMLLGGYSGDSREELKS